MNITQQIKYMLTLSSNIGHLFAKVDNTDLINDILLNTYISQRSDIIRISKNYVKYK